MKETSLVILIVLFSIQLIAQREETISKNEIKSQIYFLASDEMKGRKNGSTEIDISASFLANTLRAYNVKPAGENKSFYQFVPMQKTSKASKTNIKVGKSIYDNVVPISLFENIDYSEKAVFLNYGQEEDYKNKDVEGKVVIIKSKLGEDNDPNTAFTSITEKQKFAKAKGAIGIIELLAADDDFIKKHSDNANTDKFQLQNSSVNSFFHLWVQDLENNFFKKNGHKNTYETQISVTGMETYNFMGRNVVGIVEGTDSILKNEVIVFSAHYDHLGIKQNNVETDSIFNGARDNAVGVAAVLNTAKSFAITPTKRTALFILFTGEEIGLLGSKWYTDHPVIPLDKTIYCFNSDNGGYNDKSIATVVGLNRTSANENITKAAVMNGLKAVDTAPQDRGLFYFSDNINFANKGIPCATFSLGFKTFDAEIYQHYHQVSDNPETLDYDYLKTFIVSYVSASRLIANDPMRPFWKNEDPFYDIGKELYGLKN